MQTIVAEIVEGLDENLRELFEEWAVIFEFDAGLLRARGCGFRSARG